MAQVDAKTTDEIYLFWQSSFANSTVDTDPDDDLTDGVTEAPGNYDEAILVEPTAGSTGITHTRPQLTGMAQTSRGHAPKSQPGPPEGVIDMSIRAKAGNTILAGGEEPDGGPYSSILDVAFGDPMGTSEATTTSAGASATEYTATAIDAFKPGNIVCLSDVTTPSTEIRSIAMIYDVTGSVIKSFPDLAFTPTATDTLRQLMTWSPYANPTDHPSTYAKKRSRDDPSLDGVAHDYSGVNYTAAQEWGDIGQEATWHIVGMLDDYRDTSAPENPVLEIGGTSMINTDVAPIFVGSRLYLDSNVIPCIPQSIDPGLTLNAQPASGSKNGRSGYTYTPDPTDPGPIWTVDVRHDQDYNAAMKAATLYTGMLQIGDNSRGLVAADDHTYWIHISPCVQIVAVVETVRNDLKYMTLTLKGRRSETSGLENLHPYYVGCPGKVA